MEEKTKENIRLYLETSGQTCSVALYSGVENLSLRESEREKSHASLITIFIEEVLSQAGLTLKDVNHIAVSSGPGSYTGLRVGYSTAKGICYALGIPLIAVNSLSALASGLSLKHKDEDALYCPMIDARRMEVYTALYTYDGKEILIPSAYIIENDFYQDYLGEHWNRKIIFGGSGVKKLEDSYPNDNMVYDADIKLSATFISPIANVMIENKLYEKLAYAEPFYLKSVYINS